MFDIGFWELALVGLIALLVIGPERLPRVARLTGFWIGKARSMAASVRQEIREELYAEEIRQTLAQQSPPEDLNKLVEETSSTVQSVSDAVEEVAKPVKVGLKDGWPTAASKQSHGK